MDRDRTQPTADPLARIGGTLVAAARRQQAIRRRRRRVLATVATAVGLLTATGGAMAVTGGSTGVAAIDRWLASTEEHQPLPPPGEGPPVRDAGPVPGTLSPPFEVTLEGEEGAVAAGYRRGDGMLCAVLLNERYRGERPAGSTCLNRRLLVRGLEQRPAQVVGGGGHMLPDGSVRAVVTGFARPDVRSLGVLDPRDGERTEAVLSEPWEPYAPRPPRVRVFLAVMEPLPPPEPGRRPTIYSEVEVELEGGRRVRVAP